MNFSLSRFSCLILLVSSFLCGCSKSIGVTGVRLSESSVTLKVGESTSISAVVVPSDADYETVKWSSSDPFVASVEDGVIRANKVGTTKVTASAGGVTSAPCNVTVDVIHVQEVSLNVSAAEMTEGEELTLYSAVFPSNAANPKVFWSSSDEKVASVSDQGIVTAVSAGIARITVTSEDMGLTATCQVTVKQKSVEVSGVTLSSEEVALKEGEKCTLVVTVSPVNATDKTVTWSSSDESVVTVDPTTGEITAVSSGEAVVLCTAGGGTKTASCRVTVAPSGIPVTGITVSPESITLALGEKASLKARITPADATDREVIWSSSNESVVSVDPVSGEITAKAVGMAVVTCTTADGSKAASCSVTVATKVPVTQVMLSTNSLFLSVGQTHELSARVLPENAANKEVAWRSNNTAVATVSSSGVVTARGTGIAIVSAISEDGGKSASCRVTVSASSVAVTSVTLDRTSLNLTEGESTKLVASVIPSNATDISVAWSSSNPSVATVSSSGVVSAHSTGTAIISCVTNDGSKKATCTVTVKRESSEEINIQSVAFIPQITINGLPGFIAASYCYYPLKGNYLDSNMERWVASQDDKKQIPMASIVQYHVNGSNTSLDDTFSYSFVYNDTPSYSSRSYSSDDFSMVPVFKSYSDGVLTLSVTVNGYPATGNDNTLFALKITKGDFSIVSDYATMKSEEYGDFRIADPQAVSKKCKGLDDEHYRRGDIGISNIDPEALYRPDIAVWTSGSYFLDESFASCDTTVAYDASLDLKTVTIPHVSIGGKDFEMDAYAMQSLGFEFAYETVKNYTIEVPAIDQANYANLWDGVFSPRPYYSNKLDAIGHTPIIRVKLMHGYDIVQVAYVKIYITDSFNGHSYSTDNSFELIPRRDAEDAGENIFRFSEGGDCLMTTFRDMNGIIYGGKGMTKYEFHSIYDSLTIAPQGDHVGIVSDVIVDSASSAHLISWTLEANDLKAYAGKEVSIIARYFNSKNPHIYVDITMTATVASSF